MQELDVEGRRVTLTNLDRVLWPRAGFTKRDLVDYYARVAPVLLPHLRERALTLGRFPAGVDSDGFAQTECRGRPPWMATLPVRLRDGRLREYCMVGDVASLMWVANQSALELHPFLARGEYPGRPTVVAFDLDPGRGADLLDCCRVALRLRELLERLGLAAFAKTSGSLGLHVHVPVGGEHGYEDTKSFARELATRLTAEDPRGVTDRTPQAERAGRVFVDWLGNDASRTTVAPYSPRATDWPTVSAPVTWDEVAGALRAGRPELLSFMASDFPRRIESIGDPFAPTLELRQRLPL